LLNASPDVRDQLTRLPSSGQPSTPRYVPIEGVLLTDAELDHSLGIVLLREGRHLPLYTTAAIVSVLENDSRILPVTRAFANVPHTELPLDRQVELRTRDGAPAGLTVEAFEVPAGPPQFASAVHPGHTVGLMIRETATGRSCAFVPGCGGLDAALLQRLAHADILLFDGTFWTDDELALRGIGTRTAREMDHLPIAGEGGSLAQLATLPCRHRVYTHINNTNPILLEHSPERAAVEQAGLTIGYDGLHLTA
jgi:pyrroloquinoline quinone biosynthesis protein B